MAAASDQGQRKVILASLPAKEDFIGLCTRKYGSMAEP